jgi:hypothetical protein
MSSVAIAFVTVVALAVPLLPAQEATLDVLDGETLYEGGWLVTLSGERETRDELQSGWQTVDDPLDRRAEYRDTVLAVHHGLRHDLQLSLVVPWVDRSLRLQPAGQPATRLSTDGLGDVVALAKWRFHRWDAPHKAWNNALIVGLELPTGEDDATDSGLLLPPDIQAGRGSWNPMLGIASTYEPGRWRFNAVALYQHGGGGGEFEAGDSLFAELSVGNRFWLEPYPGPFMRADLALRHRRDERVHVADDFLPAPPLANDPTPFPAGGELTSLALNWAFRPRPTLDLQIEVETPVSQHSDGDELAADTTVSLRLGYRF